jgi:hypothetical protein
LQGLSSVPSSGQGVAKENYPAVVKLFAGERLFKQKKKGGINEKRQQEIESNGERLRDSRLEAIPEMENGRML